jgi:hypothetical protein
MGSLAISASLVRRKRSMNYLSAFGVNSGFVRVGRKPRRLRASQTWRRILISEFELKQVEELRTNLDEPFRQRTAPANETAFKKHVHESWPNPVKRDVRHSATSAIATSGGSRAILHSAAMAGVVRAAEANVIRAVGLPLGAH